MAMGGGAAPPSGPQTYGWFGGGFGFPIVNIVDRITLADDTTNALDRCDLSVSRAGMGGISDSSHGWFGGGYLFYNNVDRITLSDDTTNAIDRCDLTISRFGLSAFTDETYGWFSGGRSAGALQDVIDRITLADDTTNAIDRCNMTEIKYSLASFTDGVYGWFGGGDIEGAPPYTDSVERITLANDAVNAVHRCNLTIPKSGPTGFTDNTYGWFGGGMDAALRYNEIERITIADDTVNAIDRSDLFLARAGHAAFTDGTYGWFSGGRYGAAAADVTDVVDRITLSNDTVNALDRCNLALARSLPAGFTGSA